MFTVSILLYVMFFSSSWLECDFCLFDKSLWFLVSFLFFIHMYSTVCVLSSYLVLITLVFC